MRGIRRGTVCTQLPVILFHSTHVPSRKLTLVNRFSFRHSYICLALEYPFRNECSPNIEFSCVPSIAISINLIDI